MGMGIAGGMEQLGMGVGDILRDVEVVSRLFMRGLLLVRGMIMFRGVVRGYGDGSSVLLGVGY